MRPIQKLVTSANTPVIIPTSYRNGAISIVATPAGAGNYTIAFTTTNVFDSSLTPVWVDITAMTTATTTQNAELGTVTAIRATLHSGTSVELDIAQSDV